MARAAPMGLPEKVPVRLGKWMPYPAAQRAKPQTGYCVDGKNLADPRPADAMVQPV
jgi:hypothetical protein